MWLLNSFIGSYLTQTIIHSLITILMIERAIQIWDIRNPVALFRYRLMTLVLPVTMIPFYYLIEPERSSLIFREERALLSMNRWLSIEIWDVIPLSAIFFLVLAATSAIFVFQEVIPILRDLFAKKETDEPPALLPDSAIDSMVADLSRALGIEKPSVMIIDDDHPVMLTAGKQHHTIILSSGMLRLLDHEQLHSAIAHEFAHIVRRSNATTWAIFILRALMFFNPIVLVVFRRIVQDDEHVCDDITVSLTRKPHVLASALKIFYSSQHETASSIIRNVSTMKEGIENYSHNLLLKERISRLENGQVPEEADFAWGKFLITLSTICILNFFIV